MPPETTASLAALCSGLLLSVNTWAGPAGNLADDPRVAIIRSPIRTHIDVSADGPVLRIELGYRHAGGRGETGYWSAAALMRGGGWIIRDASGAVMTKRSVPSKRSGGKPPSLTDADYVKLRPGQGGVAYRHIDLSAYALPPERQTYTLQYRGRMVPPSVFRREAERGRSAYTPDIWSNTVTFEYPPAAVTGSAAP